MIGNLCKECNSKQACESFGISSQLISRLMIAKSAYQDPKHFPISLYKREIEDEQLNIDATLRFIEEISPHCIYVQ